MTPSDHGGRNRFSEGSRQSPGYGRQGRSARATGNRQVPNDAGCVYVGYFIEPTQFEALLDRLDEQGLGDGHLHRMISCPHVTIEYMPRDAHGELFGATQVMTVVGYGNDGRNEGVMVELGAVGDGKLDRLGESVPLPHVTLSVSRDGKPVDTGGLEFVPLDEPFELEGRFGGFTTDKRVVFEDPLAMPPDTALTPEMMAVMRRQNEGASHPVSVQEVVAPMRNPAIPPDGLVTDVNALADRVASSAGMVVVTRGAAGCGKSTLISMLGDDATVVCPDDIRVHLFGIEQDDNGKWGIPQRDGGRVWGMARRQVAEACASPGAPVVIDAMHSRPRDIKQWQDIARQTGREVVVVDMTDVPREVARERNAGRPEWKQVPESVVDRFYDLAEQNTQDIRRRFACVDRIGFAKLVSRLANDRNKA